MYLPSHFEESRPEVLHALMAEFPMAIVVALTDAGLSANPLPLMFDAHAGPAGTLRGHVARANPLWREARTDVEALAIFQGPQAYVSPGWYPSKQEHGKAVPTWNYVVVQARGHLRFIDDAAWLRDFVGALSARHEAGRSEPWKLEDAPQDYIAQTLKAIVGFELELTSLSGKWKVSQNRPAADRAGVAAGLRAATSSDAHAMATLVERHGGDAQNLDAKRVNP